MQERIKGHNRDIQLARTQTSAVSEHAHETGHYPIWNEVKFIETLISTHVGWRKLSTTEESYQ